MNPQTITQLPSQASSLLQEKGAKPLSLKKLAVLNMATAGLYAIYWSYRNWKLLAENFNQKVIPELCLIGLLVPFTSPFMFWFQFGKIKQLAKQNNVAAPFSPFIMAACHFLFSWMSALTVLQSLTYSDPTHFPALVAASLVFYLSLSTWILWLVQETVNELVN